MIRTWRRWLASAGLAYLFSVALLSSMPAAAQDEPDDPTSLEFRAVDGGEVEDVDGGALMVAAYGIIFVLLLGYVLYLARIQAGTSAELVRLKAAVEKRRTPPETTKEGA